MFRLAVLTCLLAACLALPHVQPRDDDCPSSCKLPNCQCARTGPPNNIPKNKVPQLVLLTFDDAVVVTNIHYYDVFNGKKNPDGCPISATYFVSHEYTDYSLVHDLYKRGHEIALHSITHTPDTEYWKTASVSLLKSEFGDLREIIAHFANIPKEDMKGLRIPFLQMSGDNSTKAMKELGLMYDCSWPTQTYRDPGLWPYTLDYESMQDCNIGPCPQSSFPGMWVQPMIDWIDEDGKMCAMTDACVQIPSDVDGLLKYMKKNFEVQYNGDSRAPFGFYIHAAWFATNPNHYEAYVKFIEYLNTLKDVYIVNVSRALEYAKNPKPLDKIKESWPKCNSPKDTSCTAKVCQLKKGEEIRYMTSCATSCPKKYPWLGNPLGH